MQQTVTYLWNGKEDAEESAQRAMSQSEIALNKKLVIQFKTKGDYFALLTGNSIKCIKSGIVRGENMHLWHNLFICPPTTHWPHYETSALVERAAF